MGAAAIATAVRDPAHALCDPVGLDRGIGHSEERDRVAVVFEERRARLDQDAVVAQLAGEGERVEPVRALDPEIGAAEAGGAGDFQTLLLERGGHDVAALGEGLAHVADQAVIVPERQEIGDRALLVARRVAQHQGAQLPGFADERFRADQVAEPQAREQCLGEAADIDHAAGPVERLQAGLGGVRKLISNS